MVRIMPPGEGHSTVIFASHAKRNNPNAVYIVQKGLAKNRISGLAFHLIFHRFSPFNCCLNVVL